MDISYHINIYLAALGRYLFRVKKELILFFVYLYFYWYVLCEGQYYPMPKLSAQGMLPYFTFGMRNRGSISRRNTYIEGLRGPFADPTRFDLLKNSIDEGIQFENSNFTYVVPTKWPAADSWSPDMLEFIRYNKEDNDKLTDNDKVIFNWIVDEIDTLAQHNSKWQRRLCHKYEQANLRDRVAADLMTYGFFRMDSAFVLPNDHNSTKVFCKLVWDVKEVTLMSKYHLYMTNSMLKDQLREFRQVMEYLDNAQDLPKYYDSPDWNLNGKLGAEYLQYDQFLQEPLPELEGISYDTNGPNWWPLANNRYAQADGRNIVLRSLRNYHNGTAYLHKDAAGFWGINRAHTYIDRFDITEEEDVNDQNRFNYGHYPLPHRDGHAKKDLKGYWENSYCPWGYEGKTQEQVTNKHDIRKFEKLALESYLTGDESECFAFKLKEGKQVTIKMDPTIFALYGAGESDQCHLPDGLAGGRNPGYYMDKLRKSFPFNDDCYNRAVRVNLPLWYGQVRGAVWAYLKRWNWFDANQQGHMEWYLWIFIAPALLCGNHRGKVANRLNKVHD